MNFTAYAAEEKPEVIDPTNFDNEGFATFVEGSSAFAADLFRFTNFMEPLVELAKGLSKLVGMFA